MDYSRPVTAGSHVVVLRGGYRVQVTLARDIPDPQAAGIAERRRPTPRKGPAATASNALPQQPRRAPRKGPPSSDPAALPTQAPPAPRPGQSQGPFNGLGPVNGTCDYCRSKKKGCDGSQQRPCTRCKGLGFSAAQCVNSGGKKTATPAKNKKRARKDDDEDDNGGDGPPPAKRGRGRPRKNQNQQAETQGDTNVQANHVGAAPVYSAADGVSAVAGRGIRVPVKVQRIRDEE
ncbi:hypothetical protein HII31_01689 [Pseudocercospora fuligena]|uniref:Zn(2)-C6 fungal-type domain-containing protein n=1 Tax=Pseudocercospora fuligena TaxID=685502 RepID=A0A8H6RT36_9PEZI|nr:hypothetical protein HII31_01689 [Pseudocercospora fuligena]